MAAGSSFLSAPEINAHEYWVARQAGLVDGVPSLEVLRNGESGGKGLVD